jgi:hypothetical protein
MLPVRGAAKAIELEYGAKAAERPGYRHTLIETSVPLNAALTAATLQQEFRGRLKSATEVVFGVYNLASRRVQLPLSDPNEVRLTHCADDPDQLRSFARELVLSDAIRGELAV